jgi:hypothetical protein
VGDQWYARSILLRSEYDVLEWSGGTRRGGAGRGRGERGGRAWGRRRLAAGEVSTTGKARRAAAPGGWAGTGVVENG